MKFQLFKTLLISNPTALSLVISIVTLAVIGSITITRQLVTQQRIGMVDADYHFILKLANLQYKHHQFADLAHREQRSTAALVEQQALVEQSYQELAAHSATVRLDPQVMQSMEDFAQAWQAAKQSLTEWRTPEDSPTPLVALEHSQQMLAALLAVSEKVFAAEADRWNYNIILSTYFLIAVGVLFYIAAVLTIGSFIKLLMQRQEAEQALSASEQRHRALLESIPDIVLRRTRSGIYTDYKPARAFGQFMPPTALIGKSIFEILPPAVAQLSQVAAEKALDSGEEQSYEYQMHQRLSGLLRNYEARVTPISQHEVQVIIRDITEEKQQEERLRQAQKLESLGMLAGGIAHDFNNLLTGILAQNSLARAKLMRGKPALEQVEKAITAAERAADLTRQLLAYAGRGKFQITTLDLNQLIQENVGFFETALPNRARLQVQLAQEPLSIEADRGQIQQVVMNLVINAAEALGSEGGCVAITTTQRLIAEDNHFADRLGETLQTGQYAVLEVADNGVGMDENTVSRIFDPFFSTKTKGHGLGLAATLGIIHTHRGGIDVKSQAGVGTTFTVVFPLLGVSSAQLPSPTEAVEDLTLVGRAEQYVLVIDDEAPIREVVCDILSLEGIKVIGTSSGAEGVALYQREQARIGAILLDMKMPGMSGEETFSALRTINPNVQVIFSSGYTETEIHHLFQTPGIVAFLQKPYNLGQLLQAVRQALAVHLETALP